MIFGLDFVHGSICGVVIEVDTFAYTSFLSDMLYR